MWFMCHVLGKDTSLSQCFSPVTLGYKQTPMTLMMGVPCNGCIPSRGGGVEILLDASCYRNWDKLWPDGPLGLWVDKSLSCYSG